MASSEWDAADVLAMIVVAAVGGHGSTHNRTDLVKLVMHS